MITISNCPITGLERKLTYDFLWFNSASQIVINCKVSYYDGENIIESKRISSYYVKLTASDTKVSKQDGHILTQSEIDFDKSLLEPYIDEETGDLMPSKYESIVINEYDYYRFILGTTPIIIPDLIEQIILARDAEGKFNV